MAAVTVHSDLEPKKIKSVTVSTFSPSNLPESDGTGCHDLHFMNVEFQARFSILFCHLHQEALLFLSATAKSLQSCLTLGDPIDGSPPGSCVHGILQARVLEWVAIAFSNALK